MHRDRNDRRRVRVLRWAVWLAAGSVAVLLTVRALPDDDAVEVLGAAITALRAAETALDDAAVDIGAAAETALDDAAVDGAAAETALDDAAVDIGAAAEAPRGQDAATARTDSMPDAARQAESAARAAGRASTDTRAVMTRLRHMRMERSGTFAEAVAAVRGLRDATRALMAAVAALRDGAEVLRDAGAVRAAHRALLAADDTLDAADTVLQATEAALDDERFDDPPPSAGRTRAAVGTPDLQGCPPPPAAAARSSARAPLSTLVRL